MLSKEWRDARWRLLLAALAILIFVAVTPRSYAMVLEDIRFQVKMNEEQLTSPEAFMGPGPMPPGYTQERYEEEARNQIEEMRQPEYALEVADAEVMDLQMSAGFMVLVPVAALLGVALISGEVSRGTVFLLLSQPIGRVRVLLTKYLISVLVLLAVALLGGVGVVVSAHAHGYPAAAIDTGQILAQAGSFWLGTASVLGVATLASVVFRDVIRSFVATAASLFLIFSLPDIINEIARRLSSSSPQEYYGLSTQQGWYAAVEYLRIINYWFAPGVYGVPPQPRDLALNLSVCLVTAMLPLFAALWLFRRKSY